jgi:Putative Ig domain
MIKAIDSSDITISPFVVSKRWNATNRGTAYLLYQKSTQAVYLPDTLTNPLGGVFYTINVDATHGLPPYIYSFAGGQFPIGLTLTSNGTISGVPTEYGVFLFTLKVVDNNGFDTTHDYEFDISYEFVTVYGYGITWGIDASMITNGGVTYRTPVNLRTTS